MRIRPSAGAACRCGHVIQRVYSVGDRVAGHARRCLSVRLLLAMPAAVAFTLAGSMAVIDILQSQNPPGPGIRDWIQYTASCCRSAACRSWLISLHFTCFSGPARKPAPAPPRRLPSLGLVCLRVVTFDAVPQHTPAPRRVSCVPTPARAHTPCAAEQQEPPTSRRSGGTPTAPPTPPLRKDVCMPSRDVGAQVLPRKGACKLGAGAAW